MSKKSNQKSDTIMFPPVLPNLETIQDKWIEFGFAAGSGLGLVVMGITKFVPPQISPTFMMVAGGVGIGMAALTSCPLNPVLRDKWKKSADEANENYQKAKENYDAAVAADPELVKRTESFMAQVEHLSERGYKVTEKEKTQVKKDGKKDIIKGHDVECMWTPPPGPFG